MQNIVTHKHNFITVRLISILFFFFSFKLTICTVSSILLRRETCVIEEPLNGMCVWWGFDEKQFIAHCIHVDQLVSYVVRSAASTGSMQEGHVKERISQSSIQSLWYTCMQGRNRSMSPSVNSTMQMTHLETKNNKHSDPNVYCRMYWTKGGSYWVTMPAAKSHRQVSGILCPLLAKNLAIHQTKSAMLTVQPKLASLILHAI